MIFCFDFIISGIYAIINFKGFQEAVTIIILLYICSIVAESISLGSNLLANDSHENDFQLYNKFQNLVHWPNLLPHPQQIMLTVMYFQFIIVVAVITLIEAGLGTLLVLNKDSTTAIPILSALFSEVCSPQLHKSK